MWKVLNESVEGTSHRQSGQPCQDSCFVSPLRVEEKTFLILACSDGAGSASHSQVGSKLACDTVSLAASAYLQAGNLLASTPEDVVRGWVRQAHDAIEAMATEMGVVPRELACTLLIAVIGPTGAAFAQVGDGAIVILEGGSYRPIFWPANGEYQNTTFFVTDAKFEENIRCEVSAAQIEELALFTDGLQMLALNYASKSAHEPFFRPMFKSLREVQDQSDLHVPMKQFLDSPAVNERTDDDKTLILATRLPPSGDTA